MLTEEGTIGFPSVLDGEEMVTFLRYVLDHVLDGRVNFLGTFRGNRETLDNLARGIFFRDFTLVSNRDCNATLSFEMMLEYTRGGHPDCKGIQLQHYRLGYNVREAELFDEVRSAVDQYFEERDSQQTSSL